MSFSLGEVEVMARKAARGAGYPWGVADEAGFAVRWLEARGQGGIAGFADLLEQVAGTDIATLTPHNTTDWSSDSQCLCPFMAGTALADAAALLPDGPLTLPKVLHPLLLVPFAAHLAGVKGQTLRFDAGDMKALVSANEITCTGPWPNDATLKLRADLAKLKDTPRRTRATPDAAHWRILNRFASRTYAPATEASRLKGAGAGLTDND